MATHSSVLAWRIPGTGGAWWAAVRGVTQSRTRLKWLSSSSMFPLWLSTVIIFFIIIFWLWKIINIFYYCDYVTITHLISLYHDWSTEKLCNSVSPKLPFNRKTCNHFLKSICVSELPWNFLKTTNIQVLLFFIGQRSRYISNEQPCLKTTGLYEDLLLLSSLFHFFYFIFSALISFSLCFPISPSSFFDVLSQAFIKHSRSFCIHICNIYILQNVWIFA